MCCVRLNRHHLVVQAAEEALRFNISASGYFLRGKAYTLLGKFQMAKDDLLSAKALAPSKLEVRDCFWDSVLQAFQEYV